MAAAQERRQLFDIELEPVAGSRFQPTGFPDLGPAEFDRPTIRDGHVEWDRALIVESPQSMANRLEEVGWDDATQDQVPTLQGLPYVRVVAEQDGRYLTSSRTEAHRLASAFVKDSSLDGRPMTEVIRERLGLRDDAPLAPREIARAVFALDPLSLLHGVFFAESAKVWPGQPRIARAVTGFIEAIDVRPAHSGGVKRDEVRHQIGDAGGAAEGYGSVPYHRTEYTAARIVASFSIDLAQIRAYALEEPAGELLETIARWEIGSLLERGLRLRTACDLIPANGEVRDRGGASLSTTAAYERTIRDLIDRCGAAGLLGVGGPLEVKWDGGTRRGRRGRAQTEEGEGGES